MKITRIYFWTLLIIFIASSCVPARKYEELNERFKILQNESSTSKQSLQSTEAQLAELQASQALAEKKIVELENDTSSLGIINRRLLSQYDKINTLNDELLKKYAALQKGSQDENTKLLGELNETQLSLQQKEDELKKLDAELNAKGKNLEQMNLELEKREEKVNELKDLISKKDEAVKALKNKIADALLSYKDKGLTVEQKNGKVYVSLENKLLFPSGSTEVDSKGKEALVKLAKVIEDQTDIEIVVEGHTDTDKLNSTNIPHNNWELSVLRSTAVVDIILKNSRVDPKKLVAAGRGEFLPVSSDKSKNRRIEIMITPNLDKILKIINSESK